MTITAKYASICPGCQVRITPGTKVEWSKGSPARHVTCTSSSTTQSAPRAPSRNWDPNMFRGYGAARGGFRRACKTDGNCSSFGSGRSCGGHDCDGY